MSICIFGDSIAWGADDPVSGGWATLLRNEYAAKARSINVYNLGVCGDTTADILSRLETEARVRSPKKIIFAIGINDTQFIHSSNSQRVSLEQFRLNLSNLLVLATPFTRDITFIGLTHVDELKTTPRPNNANRSYFNETIQQFDQEIKQLCSKNSLLYISMENVISDDDLTDGLHPDTKGHQKMFTKIQSELK